MYTLHLISHTHWDREWYMPFEKHRFLLVKFMDRLIEHMEKHPEFKFFHLDGHVIPVLDYLEIRPQMKDRLLKLIKDNRIQVGPWYILQDAYLSTGEAHIRNLKIGLNLCKEMGIEPLMVGYFPDTFGNIAQAPQILKGFHINSAVFGRGINEIGFNNKIIDNKPESFSEIIWKSPNESEVVAVVFSNWYCNAVDLPENEKDIKERFENIINLTKQFSHTNQLLGMNGCDHTPPQLELPMIIEKAKKIFPNIKIVQSNFKDYIKSIIPFKQKFEVVTGEMIGQKTSGYGLLVDTASTRIDIKILNAKIESKLIHQVEPLITYLERLNIKTTEITNYLDYAWKLLLQNHVHDSICSCNVDEVNAEVKMRFEKISQVLSMVQGDTLKKLSLYLSKDKPTVIIFNHHIQPLDSVFEFDIDVDIKSLNNIIFYDQLGKEIPIQYKIIPQVFTYELPDNGFRKVTYKKRFNIMMYLNQVPPLSYSTLTYEFKKSVNKETPLDFDNDIIKVTFNPNGTFDVYKYANQMKYANLHVLEYTTDIGDSYNYKQSLDRSRITTEFLKAKTTVISNNFLKSTMKIEYKMQVPRKRNQNVGSMAKTSLSITSYVTVEKNSPLIKIKTIINNKVKDVRIRALFNHSFKTEFIEAEGQFHLNKRSIKPFKTWKNESQTNRFKNFVDIHDDNHGMIVATQGIHEYEALYKEGNKVAITLLRAVGELGDWGVFPAPHSQMQGIYTLNYALGFYKNEERCDYHHKAYQYTCQPWTVFHNENIAETQIEDFDSLLLINEKKIHLGAHYIDSETSNHIMRFYSLSNEIINTNFKVSKDIFAVSEIAMDQSPIQDLKIYENAIKLSFKPFEIKTLKIQIKNKK